MTLYDLVALFDLQSKGEENDPTLIIDTSTYH